MYGFLSDRSGLKQHIWYNCDRKSSLQQKGRYMWTLRHKKVREARNQFQKNRAWAKNLSKGVFDFKTLFLLFRDGEPIASVAKGDGVTPHAMRHTYRKYFKQFFGSNPTKNRPT